MLGRSNSLAGFLFALVAGCSPGRPAPADAAGLDAVVAPGTDAGTPGADAGPPIRLCQRGCTAPSDCSQGLPAFDADNYTCEAGRCRYAGCNDDAECAATSATLPRCLPSGGGEPMCQRGCTAASDCSQGVPAFDTDNYACEAGACRYLGCTDDAECAATSPSSSRCADTGEDVPYCSVPCTVASDCSQGLPAYDDDNYACRDGLCFYTGCRDDAECAATSAASPRCL